MMNLCVTTHPNNPPLPLNPPNTNQCLYCTLATLTNTHAIPTRRQSAAHDLKFVAQTARLHRLGHSFALSTVTRLLDTLFSLPESQVSLSNDLVLLIAQIAISYDAQSHSNPSVCTAVLSAIVQAIIQTPHPCAAPLLARLLAPSENSSVPVDPHPLAHRSLIPHLLQSPRHFEHLTTVLVTAIPLADHLSIADTFHLLEEAIPPKRHLPADLMFLHLVAKLVEHSDSSHAPLFVESRPLIIILQNAFISSMHSIRNAASQLFARLVNIPSLPEFLCQNIFDYIIEGMRTQAIQALLPSDQKALHAVSLYALAALVKHAPKNLSDKWCYSLYVLLDITEHLDQPVHTSALCAVLQNAVQCAPIPVFNADIVDALVSFIMRVCLTCLKTLTSQNQNQHVEVLRGTFRLVSDLFQRWRPCVRAMHSVLRICECLARPDLVFSSIFPFMVLVIDHYKCIVTGLKEGDNIKRKYKPSDIQQLGQRIVFLIFDTFAGVLEGTIAPSGADISSQKCEEIALAMIMMTAGLDQIFVETEACTLEDQLGMQGWCWRFLPPRLIFGHLSSRDQSTVTRQTIQKYIKTVCNDDVNERGINTSSYPYSEEVLLNGLKSDIKTMSTCCSFRLLRKSITINSVDSLAHPEVLVEAMLERLSNISASSELKDKINTENHIGETVRAISHVCSRYELCFPSEQVSEDALETTINRESFCLTNASDCAVMQHIVTRKNTNSSLDVAVWDMYANHCRYPDKQIGDQESIIWDLLVNDIAVCQSATYAISKSYDSNTIVDCFLDISEKRNAQEILIRAFEKAGVMNRVCSVLHQLKNSFGKNSSFKGKDEHEGYNVLCERVSSFFKLMLCSERSISYTSLSWEVTRASCETFVRESTAEGKENSNCILLAIVRCLVSILKNTKDSSRITYITKSGVESKALHVLRNFSREGQFNNDLASTTACLVVLLLEGNQWSGEQSLLNPHILDFLRDKDAWERLLSPYPVPVDVDPAYRIANCCYLLDVLLHKANKQNYPERNFISNKTIILLCEATSSISIALRIAACTVLRTIMSFRNIGDGFYPVLSVHEEVSDIILEMVCSGSTKDRISVAHVQYLQEAIRCGHLDTLLELAQNHVVQWLCEMPSTQSPANVKKAKEEILPFMGDLFYALEARILCCSRQHDNSITTIPKLKHKQIQTLIKTCGTSKEYNTTLVVTLDRYSIVVRKVIQKSKNIHPTEPMESAYSSKPMTEH